MSDPAPLPDDPAELSEWVRARKAKGAMPQWLEPGTLPPLRWKDGGDAPIAEAVVSWMRRLGDPEHLELLRRLKERLDPASASDFAWEIFQRWEKNRALAAHRWAMEILAVWGDDPTAELLGRRIQAWLPRKGYKLQRAAAGLTVLGEMRTPAAWSAMDFFAGTLRFPTLREQAETILAAEAARRGVDREVFSDQLAASFGFDARGRRTLMVGPRRLELLLGDDGAVTIVDETGKALRSLPRAGKSLDPSAALEAANILKDLKSDLKEQASYQADRLERAMVDGRRWPVADFRRLFLEHPLLRRFSRRLLWSADDRENRRLFLFRLAEDWTVADAEDEMVEIGGAASISLPHPLVIETPALDRWKEIFADYAIQQPFEQLQRSVHTPREEEFQGNVVARYLGWCVDSRVFLDQLKRMGWTHGYIGGAGSVEVHGKSFPRHRACAVLYHSVVFLGEGWTMGERSTAAIVHLAFSRGLAARRHGWQIQPNEALPIAQVDPLVFSEAVRDLDRLARMGPGFHPDWRGKVQM